jgi:hypothetical protein
MKRTDGFKRGTGAFKCRYCDRMTRETNAVSVGFKGCYECYELGGFYNLYQDGELTESDKDQVRGLLRSIGEKGGDVAKAGVDFEGII